MKIRLPSFGSKLKHGGFFPFSLLLLGRGFGNPVGSGNFKVKLERLSGSFLRRPFAGPQQRLLQHAREPWLQDFDESRRQRNHVTSASFFVLGVIA